MMLYCGRKLKKSVAGKTILDIERLEIESGMIYGLLGANGAGKTTLLNILAFLDLPDSGSMDFYGQPVHFYRSGIQPLRRKVVMLDQHPVLFSTSVYKNIEFGLKIRNIARPDRERIIDEVLEMVDLTALRNRSAQGLSGGEVQRIALARSLALSPKVLLCDEPTASVDVENQATIVALLRKINNDQGISIIFTTHDRLLAASMAHETLVLEHGSLVRTAYENVFACAFEQREDRQVLCRLQSGVDLLLPANVINHDLTKTRVSLDPEKVFLLENRPSPDSIGVLSGKVVQLTSDGSRVRMIVNVGVMITVMLDKQQYTAQSPALGDSVWLQVDEDAVQ